LPQFKTKALPNKDTLEENKKQPVTKQEKKKRDDERRIQTMKEKEKVKMRQKSMVQTSLSDGGKPSRKTIFESDDEDHSKPSLFNDKDGISDIVFPDKSYFEDEGGDKVCMLILCITILLLYSYN